MEAEIHPLLLTTAEVAALLRTSRKAVYAMIERGQLPASYGSVDAFSSAMPLC
jgi:predicted DNA-binding transcriptional regulator AlpA